MQCTCSLLVCYQISSEFGTSSYCGSTTRLAVGVMGLFGLRLSLPKVATPKVRQVWPTWVGVWFKPHLRQATLGSHITYTQKVWQDSVRLANLWLSFWRTNLRKVWQHCMAKCGMVRPRTKQPLHFPLGAHRTELQWLSAPAYESMTCGP